MHGYTKEETAKQSVIAALQYFHIFKFPLYLEELHKFLNTPISLPVLKEELDNMVGSCEIYMHQGLYMLVNEASWADNRVISSEKASVRMLEARRAGSIIAKFPFVRSVCVSGSLSKGYADDQSDIDFFIITKANRLWVCRTLLHLFKKLTFLNNKQHSYCMNYFLDESKLLLEEQNNFTGTEIVTLIPVQDEGVYNDFMDSNKHWVAGYFPNFLLTQTTHKRSKAIIKSIGEAALELLFAGQMNKGLLLVTDKWWRYKWQKKNYPMEDYDLAMKTKWYVSKNHPANYQKKILRELKLANA